ncbi:MAG: hypothetical protein BWZ07_00584 [Alphaproteobacteria bacterium ADurb.BinA280]|jgi:hypothetical protein|nr:IPTL-CTERM sorting domain-containing protein [Xanthomonadales bacterium]OPZ13386.1 MAG: hypothetical protein BWZ07_00584 [Alphaproteobacteria bacterium ADurb.BinA280]
MSRRFACLSLTLWLGGLFGCATSIQAQTTFLGPTPYLSAADRPAGFSSGTVLVEDFEDGIVDPLLTINGSVIGPGGLADSVDADDGAIDGSGTNGRSAFSGGSADVSFSAPFPTSAGMVWTDGGTPTDVTFEAFGPTGTSLGTHGPFTLGDSNNSGGTSEDRFFGAQDTGGISRIRITHTSGGYEVDHITWSDGSGQPADLQLAIGSSATTAVTGGSVVYDISYICSSGDGPKARGAKADPGGVLCADSAFVDVSVPANAQFRSAGSSAGWTCTPDTTAGSVCRNVLGDLAFDEPGQIQFAVQVNSSVPNGTSTLSASATIAATATPGLTDPDSSNNSDSLNLPLQIAVVAVGPDIIPTLDQLGLVALGALLLIAMWAHRRSL